MQFLAALVLAVHLIWILWVIFGAFWSRGRPLLTAFHIVSLIWGIIVEASPLPCPLTMVEQFFQRRAGLAPYRGAFLAHLLDSIVYPDVAEWLLVTMGIAVCAANLLIYIVRLRAHRI